MVESIILKLFSSSQVPSIIIIFRYQRWNALLGNFSAYLLCPYFCLLRCQSAIPRL